MPCFFLTYSSLAEIFPNHKEVSPPEQQQGATTMNIQFPMQPLSSVMPAATSRPSRVNPGIVPPWLEHPGRWTPSAASASQVSTSFDAQAVTMTAASRPWHPGR
jgi:hypothetical protein